MGAEKKLSDDALKVIGKIEVETTGTQTLATITGGQLDRKVYLEVNAVLEQLGGKWNRKLRAHVFEGQIEDLDDKLQGVFAAGAYVDAQKLFQFYETPQGLARELVQKAAILGGHTVLEPSVGHGAILHALLMLHSKAWCVAMDIDPDKVNRTRKMVDEKFSHAIVKFKEGDFLKTSMKKSFNTLFDRIVMNPPFTRQQDAQHVMHAYNLLAPGGRIVSIMSAAVKFRDTSNYAWVREHAQVIEDNMANSFGASGTSVNTVTVVLEKR